MNLRKIAEIEADPAAHVPYSRLVDDQTVETTNGEILQVIEVTPFDFETQSARAVYERFQRRKTAIQALAAEDLSIWITGVRCEDSEELAPLKGAWFARKVDGDWRAAGRRSFETRWFITLVQLGVQGVLGRRAAKRREKLSAAADSLARREEASVLKLSGRVKQLITRLEGKARVLSVRTENGRRYSEPMEFLSYLVNGVFEPWPVHRSFDIGARLVKRRLFFRCRDPFIRRGLSRPEWGGVISFKEYGAVSEVGLLQMALGLPIAAVVTLSFRFLSRAAIRSRTMITEGKAASADDDTLRATEELVGVRENMALKGAVYGDFHGTVSVWSGTRERSDEALREIQGFVASGEYEFTREDLNQEAAFWAQLPGNKAKIARKATVSAGNLTAWGDLQGELRGKPTGNHWGSAVTALNSCTGGRYYFSWHVGDVGNTFILGPTGSGKTTVGMFLLAQTERFRPRGFLFDFRGGALGLVRALGGRYYDFKPGVCSGLAPFDRDDPDGVFTRKFLRALLARPDKPFTTEQEKAIEATAKRIVRLPREDRNLKNIQSSIPHKGEPGDRLSDRFLRWIDKGAGAWLFGAERDRFAALEDRIIGIDYTDILSDELLRRPFLTYWFDRIQSLMSREGKVEPWYVWLDEAWLPFRDPWFLEEFKSWELTVRRFGGQVIFATQNPSAIVKSGISDEILQSTKTKIFLADPEATRSVYCDGLHLTDREFDLLSDSSASRRRALVKRGAESVMLDLDLSAIAQWLPIFSCDPSRAKTIRSVIDRVGDEPAVWVPAYLQQEENA